MSDAPAYLEFMGVLPESEANFTGGRPVYCVDGLPVVAPGPLVIVAGHRVDDASPVTSAARIHPAGNFHAVGAFENDSQWDMSIVVGVHFSYAVRVSSMVANGFVQGRIWVAAYKRDIGDPAFAPLGGTADENSQRAVSASQRLTARSKIYNQTASTDLMLRATAARRLALPPLEPGRAYDVRYQFEGLYSQPSGSPTVTWQSGSCGCWAVGVAGGV